MSAPLGLGRQGIPGEGSSSFHLGTVEDPPVVVPSPCGPHIVGITKHEGRARIWQRPLVGLGQSLVTARSAPVRSSSPASWDDGQGFLMRKETPSAAAAQCLACHEWLNWKPP